MLAWFSEAVTSVGWATVLITGLFFLAGFSLTVVAAVGVFGGSPRTVLAAIVFFNRAAEPLCEWLSENATRVGLIAMFWAVFEMRESVLAAGDSGPRLLLTALSRGCLGSIAGLVGSLAIDPPLHWVRVRWIDQWRAKDSGSSS
jgi:hypothetical protein